MYETKYCSECGTKYNFFESICPNCLFSEVDIYNENHIEIVENAQKVNKLIIELINDNKTNARFNYLMKLNINQFNINFNKYNEIISYFEILANNYNATKIKKISAFDDYYKTYTITRHYLTRENISYLDLRTIFGNINDVTGNSNYAVIKTIPRIEAYIEEIKLDNPDSNNYSTNDEIFLEDITKEIGNLLSAQIDCLEVMYNVAAIQNYFEIYKYYDDLNVILNDNLNEYLNKFFPNETYNENNEILLTTAEDLFIEIYNFKIISIIFTNILYVL